MLFNSIDFGIFLAVVFLIYWLVTGRDLDFQNLFLLLASYFFYGCWNWRFLLLLVLISCINYFLGISISKTAIERSRRVWLIVGLFLNIGVLVVFKYYNFFVDSFIHLISVAGYNLPGTLTKIILPVGISFYIFLSISYIIEIYRKNLMANSNIVEVLLALSFFPIIIAGPIQRPLLLLPQIHKKREFDYTLATDGCRQILWGLFAKVVIADKLAFYVDDIFSNYSGYSGSTLFLGAILFSVQIYADFSGYSNMAIGTAKLFGFSLMQNFSFPYFSRDITEFWKKWHISLTTWFRDYLFLPASIAISRKIKNESPLFIKTDHFIYIVASLITWFVTGLWHGANYTFIVWGIIHGFFLIIYHLQKSPRKKLFRILGINNKSLILVISESLFTFAIITFAWVFFRVASLKDAFLFLNKTFSKSLFTIPERRPLLAILLVSVFFIIEWFGRQDQFAIASLGTKWRVPLRWAVYYALIIIIIFLGGREQEFIYSQF
jgi:alginate O-acetyltransferase complex protein AlgI